MFNKYFIKIMIKYNDKMIKYNDKMIKYNDKIKEKR